MTERTPTHVRSHPSSVHRPRTFPIQRGYYAGLFFLGSYASASTPSRIAAGEAVLCVFAKHLQEGRKAGSSRGCAAFPAENPPCGVGASIPADCERGT